MTIAQHGIPNCNSRSSPRITSYVTSSSPIFLFIRIAITYAYDQRQSRHSRAGLGNETSHSTTIPCVPEEGILLLSLAQPWVPLQGTSAISVPTQSGGANFLGRSKRETQSCSVRLSGGFHFLLLDGGLPLQLRTTRTTGVRLS
jgi:hypothetical protein